VVSEEAEMFGVAVAFRRLCAILVLDFLSVNERDYMFLTFLKCCNAF